MTQNNVPYLTGGVFFALITSSLKPRRPNHCGNPGITDLDVYRAFLRLVTGEDYRYSGDSLEKSKTNYKICKEDSGDYVPFRDSARIAFFLKKENSDLLEEVSEFINTYMSMELCGRFAEILIDLISADRMIPEEEPFYIAVDTVVTKSEIINVTSLEIEPFFISVLRFILEKRPDNLSGRETFTSIYFQASPRSAWKLKDGMGLSRSISIKHYNKPGVFETQIESSAETTNDEEAAEQTKSSYDIVSEKILASGKAMADVLSKAFDNLAAEMTRNDATKKTEEEEEDTPEVAAEIVDAPEKDSGKTENTTIIEHQTNVIQNGEKNFNLTNNGTMNFNF